MQSPVYNSLNLEMSLASSRVRWALCLILFSQLSFATDWHDPVSQLAAKITAATGPGVVALEINNRSSISSADVEEIRRQITSTLSASGVRIWQPDQAAANIKLTFSENLQDYVWVAEIQSGTSDGKVILVSTPRDRKSTRLNSSHLVISYAVFCLKKKKNKKECSIIIQIC